MMDASLELQESGWEELRKEARKIEGELDIKLSSYAKLAARFSHSSVCYMVKRKGWCLDSIFEIPHAEFRRTKQNLNSLRDHAELLNSVRDDITESKSSGSMSPRVHLLRERASIHGSISHIDEVISQAQATRSVLGTQRAFFGHVQGKVKQLGDKFPKIRGLLGAIRRKRLKDTLILSAVIAACTLFLIVYWLSK